MISLTPHLAMLAAITTGLGAVMSRMGLARGVLKMRRETRRCPCCRRLVTGDVCGRCGSI